MADREKKGGGGGGGGRQTTIQKFKYLKNEKSFIDEIKNICYRF